MNVTADKLEARDQEEMSPLAKLGGFLAFSTAGMLTLAAGILLPEYAALVDLENQQDVLAHQIRCETDLVTYNDRLIQAAQEDSVFIARQMIRYGNYRMVGMDPREVPTSQPTLSVPGRLLKESLNPPPPPRDLLADVGRWLDHPGIKGGLVLLGLGLLIVGAIIFGVDHRPLFARRKT